jgi:hypothetical protein
VPNCRECSLKSLIRNNQTQIIPKLNGYGDKGKTFLKEVRKCTGKMGNLIRR